MTDLTWLIAGIAVIGVSTVLARRLGVAGPLILVAIGLVASLLLPEFSVPPELILVGILPFWDRFRTMAAAQSLMQGANAAVVGILGAALYSPVFTSAIGDLRDLTLALACFVALTVWNAPPWIVVAGAAIGGAGLSLVS